MKFAPHTCPDCGEAARGTVETLCGRADLLFDENGVAEYSGYTEIFWDEQRTETRRPEGHQEQALLICHCGRQWYADTEW